MESQQVFLIWEEFPSSPELEKQEPTGFATTIFEARKQCMILARNHCQEQSESERPLYHGEQPKREGPTLIYTFPGPNESSIDVYNVTKTKPWFGEPMLTLGQHTYRVRYQRLPRASLVIKKTEVEEPTCPVPPPSPSAKFSSRKKERDTSSVRGQLLDAIEKVHRVPTAPPLPGKEFHEKLQKSLEQLQ